MQLLLLTILFKYPPLWLQFPPSLLFNLQLCFPNLQRGWLLLPQDYGSITSMALEVAMVL